MHEYTQVSLHSCIHVCWNSFMQAGSNQPCRTRLAIGLGPRWRQRPSAVGTSGHRGPATQPGARNDRSDHGHSKHMFMVLASHPPIRGVLPSPPVRAPGVWSPAVSARSGACALWNPPASSGAQGLRVGADSQLGLRGGDVHNLAPCRAGPSTAARCLYAQLRPGQR